MFLWFSFPMISTSFFRDAISLGCRSRFLMHFTAYRFPSRLSTHAYTTEYAPEPSVSRTS